MFIFSTSFEAAKMNISLVNLANRQIVLFVKLT